MVSGGGENDTVIRTFDLTSATFTDDTTPVVLYAKQTIPAYAYIPLSHVCFIITYYYVVSLWICANCMCEQLLFVIRLQKLQ